MDWDKLRVFHAVADAGSLTHAGEQLHLSQSAISRQIRGLEDQLQSTLFHRHARGLLLTEQGELLYEATKAMSKRVNAAAARIRDSKDEVYGPHATTRLGDTDMATTDIRTAVAPFGAITVHRVVTAVFSAVATLRSWNDTRRTINTLRTLSPAQLDDIGLTRGDIENFAHKGF